MSGTAQDRVPLGIMLGLAAYSLFTIHDAYNKWLVMALPTNEVLTFRSAAIVIACLLIGRRQLVERAFTTPLKRALVARGLLTLVAWLLYYSAARHMQLAQLQTLYYSAPIITTLLAIPILGERVNRTRAFSLALGFGGVLLASDPFGLAISTDTFLVLGAATLWGYAIVLMRQIARQESALLVMLFQSGVFLVLTLPVTLFNFQMPDGPHFAVMLVIGLMGGAGQYLLIEGCRHAPASVMGTVEYTGLAWAFALGWVIFGDIPTPAVTAGALVIASAGLFLFIHERRAARSG